jgi:Mg/Co/Ni transporter MgtE
MTPADIARQIVASEGNFQIGFITQLTNPRVAKLIEEKEKQMFKEIWEEMTLTEREELCEAFDADFPEDPTSIEDLVELFQKLDTQLEATTDKTERDQLLTERLQYEDLYQSKLMTQEVLRDFTF